MARSPDGFVPKRPDTKHFSALPYTELPNLLERLQQVEGVAAKALELCILTCTRTGEVLGATWAEVDIDQRLWTIPGARTKRARQHRVPLSDRCIEILRSIRPERNKGADLIFCEERRALPHNAMLKVLKELEPNITVHGMRSCFSDWARDRTAFPKDVVEACLAHAISDKTEASYRRGDALEKRAKLMQMWSDFCCSTPSSSTVVNLRA